MQRLVIFGSSDLAEEVAALVDEINRAEPTWRLEGFVDDDARRWGQRVLGLPVLGGADVLEHAGADAPFVVVAIGDSRVRRLVAARLEGKVRFATLVHPSVTLHPSCRVGDGSVIFGGTVATVRVTLGRHVLVNPGCTLSHGVVLGDGCTLSPGVRVSGDVTLGPGVAVGAGAVFADVLQVGADTLVGAGAVVLDSLPAGVVAVGNPARVLRPRGPGESLYRKSPDLPE